MARRVIYKRSNGGVKSDVIDTGFKLRPKVVAC